MPGPLTPPYPLAIILDFDGTVADIDVGEALVSRFGLPGWDALIARFERGEVLISQLWAHEVAHLPPERIGEMVSFAIEQGTVRPGLRELLDFCKTQAIPIEIASNGISFYVRAVLESHGLHDLPYTCLSATLLSGKPAAIDYPAEVDMCVRNGLCKCARIWKRQREGRRVIFVGDGASDACASLEPEVLFARSSLAQRAADNGWAFLPFEDFHAVLEVVRRMSEGQTR